MERRKANLTLRLVLVIELQLLEPSKKRTSIVLLSCIEFRIYNLQRLVDCVVRLSGTGEGPKKIWFNEFEGSLWSNLIFEKQQVILISQDCSWHVSRRVSTKFIEFTRILV